MKFFFINILLFLTSCLNTDLKNDYDYFKFSNNMTFNQFKLKLEKYSQEKTYPNIDY